MCSFHIDLNQFALFKSLFNDLKTPEWYHMKCFFDKFHPPSAMLLSGFGKLRLDDQNKIRKYIGI